MVSPRCESLNRGPCLQAAFEAMGNHLQILVKTVFLKTKTRGILLPGAIW